MLKFYGRRYLEGLLVDEGLNIGQAVGPSLDAVSNKQLVLHVEEQLAATVDLVAILRNVEPGGVDHAVVHVESVQAHIFRKVGEHTLLAHHGVIHWDDVGMMMIRGVNVCGQNNTHHPVEAVLLIVSE
jgi:hypothetical protein